MDNGRWISRELDHLDGYMKDLHSDIKAKNWESALANFGFAMGIIQGMKKREKESLRSVDKMGASIKFLYKKLKPLVREVAKESAKEFVKEKAR